MKYQLINLGFKKETLIFLDFYLNTSLNHLSSLINILQKQLQQMISSLSKTMYNLKNNTILVKQSTHSQTLNVMRTALSKYRTKALIYNFWNNSKRPQSRRNRQTLHLKETQVNICSWCKVEIGFIHSIWFIAARLIVRLILAALYQKRKGKIWRI